MHSATISYLIRDMVAEGGTDDLAVKPYWICCKCLAW